MKGVWFMVSCILALASSHPAPVQIDHGNCLVMTPGRQRRVNYIESEIKKLLFKLGNQFEDIDITDVLININKRTGNTKRYMTLSVTVNDCLKVKDVFGRDIAYFKQSNSNDEESNGGEDFTEEVDTNEQTSVGETDEVNDSQNCETSGEDVDAEEVSKEVASVEKDSSKPDMEVVIIKLTEKEEKLLQEMEKKRGKGPFLLIEHESGQREIKLL